MRSGARENFFYATNGTTKVGAAKQTVLKRDGSSDCAMPVFRHATIASPSGLACLQQLFGKNGIRRLSNRRFSPFKYTPITSSIARPPEGHPRHGNSRMAKAKSGERSDGMRRHASCFF